MISDRLIIIWSKHCIRLNFPRATGIGFKLDRWVFNYGNSKGLPCFISFWVIKKQLIVLGKPIYSGGGVNCFNEPVPIYPVIATKNMIKDCTNALNNGYFKIKNFEYNGFMGKKLPGFTPYTVAVNEAKLTNDPGIYECYCSDNIYRNIPSWAIKGIEVIFNPKESKKIPILFGEPSYS